MFALIETLKKSKAFLFFVCDLKTKLKKVSRDKIGMISPVMEAGRIPNKNFDAFKKTKNVRDEFKQQKIF